MYINHFTTFLIFIVFAFGCKPKAERKDATQDIPRVKAIPIDTTRIKRALDYCTKKQLNSNFTILVNLTRHSGNYRLFAVNLLTQDTIIRGLVTHGHCQEYEGRMATFSNILGSNCSSEGKYLIGNKYSGMFGTAYKLNGLDSTNSNAFSRFVVLHSHSCVPDSEQEDDICASEGCPTVSPNVLKQLEPKIDQAKKPILLWVFKDEYLNQ